LEHLLQEVYRGFGLKTREFLLTYAQELHCQRERYFALELKDSQRFDFGTPQDYVKSVAAFAGE